MVEIAHALSMSKEIVGLKKGNIPEKICKQMLRFPYVCNGCAKKYNGCPFAQFRSNTTKAQHTSDY